MAQYDPNPKFRIKVRIVSTLFVVLLTIFSLAVSGQEEEEFVQEGIISNSRQTDDADPLKLFLEAQDAHEIGDLDKALELYSAAIKEQPEFPEAEYQIGVIYHSRGQFDKAEDSFRKALEHKPDWTLAMTGLGSVLVAVGKPIEAKSVLEQALKIDGMNFPAYVSLTDAYLSVKSPLEEIKSLYSRLVYITSKAKVSGAVWASRGAVERTLGDFVEAKKSLRRSLEAAPNNRRALFEEAEIAIAASDFEGAISIAGILVREFPSDPNAKILLARGYALKGESEKALAILDAIRPPDKLAIEAAAAIRASSDDVDVSKLEEDLRSNPDNVVILGTLCGTMRRAAPDKALEFCRRAFELDPGNRAHAIGFASALVQIRQFENAIKILEELKKLDNDNHTVRANLATAYFQLGKFENAKIEYLWIIEKQPKLPAGYYFLGITHDRLMDYIEAMANYQQFLRIADPVEYEDEIGRVRLRLGPLQRQIDKSRKD